MKKLKFYIAAKVFSEEDELLVQDLSRALEDMGFEQSFDWTKNVVKKPFEERIEEAAGVSIAIMDAIIVSDIVVVIYHERLLGGHIETGIALLACHLKWPKRIYILGERGERDRSTFYFLPWVKRCRSKEEIIQDLQLL